MKFTLKMKMRPLTRSKEWMLEQSIEAFKSCVNDWLSAIVQLGIKPNRGNLHRFAYREIRGKYPQLHSNIVQDAMNLAIEIYRSWLKNGGEFPEFRSNVIYFKGVDVKVENNGLVVPLMGKRVYLPLYVPKRYKKCLQHKHGRVIIKRIGRDWYAFVSIEVPEKEPIKPVGTIGVDLGYYNLLVASDEKGREVMRVRGDVLIKHKEHLEKLTARRQQRLMKKFGIHAKTNHKDKKFVNDLNHKIAKELVLKARQLNRVIVLEKLKGIKRQKRPKPLRKILHRWSYADLIAKITYKAKLYGVPVIFVSPRGTSKTCSNCGYYVRNFKDERVFKCPKCGFEIDRDYNASINIARKVLNALKSGLSSPP
ncbi:MULTISPECIES: transposase [unclassified Thermococcus]|uniref:RNA-guided endonuclease InsQ/TnpB family protein n=1 Tax=unclassified Thermococcus TaxID=2627626 RepID=UPI001F102F55|nr:MULTISPECIES: transposase [unclassified Thermococcus]